MNINQSETAVNAMTPAGKREIVFDTETTGLDPSQGHRLCEIGCVELIDGKETGRQYHAYVNPGRSMPRYAEEIHGLSDAFLSDKPAFHEIVEDLNRFIGASPLVAHNAPFDMKFLNAELEFCGRPPVAPERAIDTMRLASKGKRRSRISLDKLCLHHGVDLAGRVKHGALVDAKLLAKAYVKMTGGQVLSPSSPPQASQEDHVLKPLQGFERAEAIVAIAPYLGSVDHQGRTRIFQEAMGYFRKGFDDKLACYGADALYKARTCLTADERTEFRAAIEKSPNLGSLYFRRSMIVSDKTGPAWPPEKIKHIADQLMPDAILSKSSPTGSSPDIAHPAVLQPKPGAFRFPLIFRPVKWSGREDSNLRPLPPEEKTF